MRDYQLSMMQILQLRYGHNSCVSVSANGTFVGVTLARFNEQNKMYGYLCISGFDDNATTRLEYLVKHGYNPEATL